MGESEKKWEIEKRIVQMHLMYPNTKAYVLKETDEVIEYKVVVTK